MFSLRLLFRPWLRVARPDDWTGMLARFGLWPVYFVALLIVGLGRIPHSWWMIGAGYVVLTRVVLAIVVIYLLGWVRMIAFSFVPKSVVQFGNRLWFRHRGRRIMVRIDSLAAIEVEQRPPPVHEAFILELDDGAVYDLCPVNWDGAQWIYSAVAFRVRRAKRRLNRQLRAGPRTGNSPAAGNRG